MRTFNKAEMSDTVAVQVKDLTVLVTQTLSRGCPVSPDLYGVWLSGQGYSVIHDSIHPPIPYGLKGKDVIRRDMQTLNSHLAKEEMAMVSLGNGMNVIYNQTTVVGLLAIRPGSTAYTVLFQGSKMYVDYMVEICTQLFDLSNVPQVRRMKISNDRVMAYSHKLKIPETITGLAGFYPHFEHTPEEQWARFNASDERILLLIGDPGLGKSTYILSMLNARGWDKNVYLVDSAIVLAHGTLIPFLSELPQGSVVVIEDADQFVSAREEGNYQMSALLNLAAGIATADLKIIISTNLPSLNKVDTALIRPGRCFDVLKFDPLVGEQVNVARAVLGRPSLRIVEGRKYSLAEALSDKDKYYKPGGIGFVDNSHVMVPA